MNAPSGTRPRVALVLGDPGGVGPEIVARLLADPATTRKAAVLLVADRVEVDEGMRLAGRQFNYLRISELGAVDFDQGDIFLLDDDAYGGASFARGDVSPVNGRYCLDTLTRAVEAALAGVTDAICFAPLNKRALHEAGIGHPDEAQWFAEVMRATGTVGELNVLDGLWTSRVTSHVPLKDVAALITPERILAAIDLVVDALGDAGVSSPRVAICGINPHNGDNGTFGREEIDVIAPTLGVARSRGVNIVGLYPADTIFLRVREVDAIVTMYHDQGQIAMKLMGFSRGVTVHGGLPVPVVTPAHGTAFDIYGKGIATTGAIDAAFTMACRMATGRKRE